MGVRNCRQSMSPEPASKCRAEIVELIPALRAFARSFYRDIDSADDLVQETLARALSGLNTFQPGTSMKSWLFTIMRNTFYTKIKIDARETPGAADCVSLTPAVDPTQEWEARGGEIWDALQRIPDHQRQVLILVGMLGVSYEEAAQVCRCATGTIKSRLHRGRERLLVELDESSALSSLDRGVRYPIASLAQLSRAN